VHLRVCVNEGLLIDAAHPLHRPNVEGVLRAEVARMRRLNLAVSFFLLFGFLQREKLLFSQDEILLCGFSL
jgi:hypothetical protein